MASARPPSLASAGAVSAVSAQQASPAQPPAAGETPHSGGSSPPLPPSNGGVAAAPPAAGAPAAAEQPAAAATAGPGTVPPPALGPGEAIVPQRTPPGDAVQRPRLNTRAGAPVFDQLGTQSAGGAFPQSHISLRVEHNTGPAAQPLVPPGSLEACGGLHVPPPPRHRGQRTAVESPERARWRGEREQLRRQRRRDFRAVQELLPLSSSVSDVSVRCVASPGPRCGARTPPPAACTATTRPTAPRTATPPASARCGGSPWALPASALPLSVPRTGPPAPPQPPHPALSWPPPPSPEFATATWPPLWPQLGSSSDSLPVPHSPRAQRAAVPPPPPLPPPAASGSMRQMLGDPSLHDQLGLYGLQMPDDSAPVVPREQQDAYSEGAARGAPQDSPLPPGFDWARHPAAGLLMTLLERRGVTAANAQGRGIIQRYMRPEVLRGLHRMMRGLYVVWYRKDGSDPVDRYVFFTEEECRDPDLPTGMVPYLCCAYKKTSWDVRSKEPLMHLVGVQVSPPGSPAGYFSPQLQPHLMRGQPGLIRTVRNGGKRVVAPSHLAGTLWFRAPLPGGGGYDEHNFRPIDLLCHTPEEAAVLFSACEVIRSINSPSANFVYPLRPGARAAPLPPAAVQFARVLHVAVGPAGAAASGVLQSRLQRCGLRGREQAALSSAAPVGAPQYASRGHIEQGLTWLRDAASGGAAVLLTYCGAAGEPGRAAGSADGSSAPTRSGSPPESSAAGMATGEGGPLSADAITRALLRGLRGSAAVRIIADTGGAGPVLRPSGSLAADVAVLSGWAPSATEQPGALAAAVAEALPVALRGSDSALAAELARALKKQRTQQHVVLHRTRHGAGAPFLAPAPPKDSAEERSRARPPSRITATPATQPQDRRL